MIYCPDRGEFSYSKICTEKLLRMRNSHLIKIFDRDIPKTQKLHSKFSNYKLHIFIEEYCLHNKMCAQIAVHSVQSVPI